ncbi:MAG: cell wall-binding repeat-containing protein, partial [Actinomycetia bacterium]|nr:cell wall-binding repeat-containing protein [Actinomycetes bacterium]
AGWYADAALTDAWDFAADTVTADMTLYAKWTVNSYTVTFNANGGSAVAPVTVAYNGLVTEPADPTKTGSTFAGWYADAALTDAWDFAADTVTADMTLYAKWTVNSYTVTFKDWDGTVLETQTVAYGGAATAPAPPSRTGYTFAGWDTEFSNITTDLTVTATYTFDAVVWTTVAGVDYARVAGTTRYDTAAQSAADAFPAGASTAVVAFGRSYADALAASPLAGAVGGPILLTETDVLPASTIQAIENLGITKVYIVGGTGVVSEKVVTQIEALGVTSVVRRAGSNRYITARVVAEEAVALGASTKEAFLVRGDDFADALAVSSIAAQKKVPILLTTTASLNPEAKAFLTAKDTDAVYIAGGTGAVSDTAAASVASLGAVVTRWAGTDRYTTGAKVVSEAMTKWSMTMDDIGIASGANYPDALAGGAVMGYKQGLLLLTNPTTLSPATASLIAANKATIESVEYFGGTGALGSAISSSVQQLLQ